MSVFFLLLGCVFGALLGGRFSLDRFIVCLLALLFGLALAIYKKKWRWYVIPFATTLLFMLFLCYFPLQEGRGSISGFIIVKSDNYVLVQEGFFRYYVSLRGNSFEVGDFVQINGTRTALSFTHYESRFDFKAYLEDLGVRQEIASPKVSTLLRNPIRFRAYQQNFLSHFNDNAKALLDSLLFGKKDYGSSIISMGSEINALFILSASGLFYGGFLRLIEGIIKRKDEEKAKVITLVASLLLLPFGAHKIGVLRVFLLRLLTFIDTKWLKRELSYLTRLSIVGLALLAFDIHNAFQSGFLLGMGASLLLYFSARLLDDDRYFLAKGKSLLLLRVYLLPLNLSQSGGLHLFALVFTSILYPLSVVVLVLGYLSLFTVPFTGLLNGLSDFCLKMLSYFDIVDAALALPAPSVLLIGAIYLCLPIVMYFIETRIIPWKRYLLGPFLVLYVASLFPIVPLLTESVSFIDVGQGDCCLIQDGLTSVMIDTGGVSSFDMAKEAVIPYLRKRRIPRIDVLFLTHQDYDHAGAAESLEKNFKVGVEITDATAFPITVGRLTFTNYNVYEAEEENDKSLVLGLDFMGKKWLFTGDAPMWIERKIIADHPELDCDILKLGHHGSDTSTCAEFLDALTPEVAIVSCGLNNKYGHPKPSIMSLLSKRHIPVRRTDKEGTITYSRLRRA